MFQRKINKLFQGLPNVLGIADDILIAEFDNTGKDICYTSEGADDMQTGQLEAQQR